MVTTAEKTCACGCGETVSSRGTWKRGHSGRGRAEERLLAAEAEPQEKPFWELEDDVHIPDSLGDEDILTGEKITSEPLGSPPPDPEPAHLKTGKEKAKKTFHAKVPITIKKDINAKLGLVLTIPGKVWEARDPLCGGTFVGQTPAICDALTEIVCQSPDLVAWFQGAGGGFMLYLNLIMACYPVITIAAAHHVFHTVELAPTANGQVPGYDYSDLKV